MGNYRCTAIVLAGGQGKRMGSDVQKQYLRIAGKPMLYYSLRVFENSGIIDDIVLVAAKGQVDYVRENIIKAYGFLKVRCIVEGGAERQDSVWAGLQAVRSRPKRIFREGHYIFIHDGARPFVTEEILTRAYGEVRRYGACVVGVPSKDTVKLSDGEGYAVDTPKRDHVWIIQTPQVFEASLIFEAYEKFMMGACVQVTDDAMVVERELGVPVKLVEGSYENIKITTPGDLDIAEVFAKKQYG